MFDRVSKFLYENAHAVYKSHLLDRAYFAIIGMVEAEVDQYLIHEGLSIEKVVSSVKESGILGPAFDHHHPEMEPDGYIEFVSQMRQALDYAIDENSSVDRALDEKSKSRLRNLNGHNGTWHINSD